MTEQSNKPNEKLSEIFAKINMSELPAMSAHVQELLTLSSGDRSTNYMKLAKIILRDFSLTNKILQFANSAYYSLGQRVTTVSTAVTVLGFETIRELAIGISLFDDFVQAGFEKEDISKLLTRSFLSALLARDIADSRDLNVVAEEAFICGLLHNLGRIIACIYLPAQYKEVERRTQAGMLEEDAVLKVLDGLTYAELGKEVARFWNMTDNVIAAMDQFPSRPKENDDSLVYLLNIVAFSNRFVETICNVTELESLMERYGYLLAVDEDDAVEMLERGMETSESIFETIRSGLEKLDFRAKLEQIENLPTSETEDTEAEVQNDEPTQSSPEPEGDGAARKYLDECVGRIKAMLAGSFRLDDFFSLLLDALHSGVGLDRVIFAMPGIQGGERRIVGRYCRGDNSDRIGDFTFPLADSKSAFSRCFNECKIMAFPANSAGTFPDRLLDMVRDRAMYLFPICIRKKPVFLIYMDQKMDRPRLTREQVNSIKILSELAGRAIEKIYKQKK